MFTFTKKYTKWISLALIVMMLAATALPSGLAQKAYAGTSTVAGWTFSGTGTAKSFPANSGSEKNLSSALFSTSNNREWTFSASNIYATGWDKAAGEYWMAQFNTEGFSQLSLSFKSYGTGTGPKDFKIEYSTNGGGQFNDLPGGAYEIKGSTNTYTFQLPPELDNQSNVILRWTNTSRISINNGALGSSGNNRMGDIAITGIPLDGGGNTDPGGTDPGPIKTDMPNGSKITFGEDYTTVMGVAGAVYDSAVVNIYLPDNTIAGTTTASTDGSFGLSINNPNQSPSVKVSASASGKDESDKITVTIPKTTKPDASKITFSPSTLVTGLAGAVPKNAKVSVYFDDNTLAGTTTADTDGAFSLNFANPSNKSVVNATSKEDGKLESDKTTVYFVVPGTSYRPGDIVFSQIYVNGGNSGAFYNTKFFELYNTTNQDISFNNQWAIIYSSATGASFGAGTKLTGTIKAHGYYLIAGATNTTGSALPVAPDLTTTLNPSGSTGGILALANSTTGLTDQDDPKAIDIVGFGNGTNTSFTLKTDHWGSPFFSSSIGGGTLLRKTDTGSDPRVAIGIGNGYFSKDASRDFVLNAPNAPANPEEVRIRNTKYMAAPDAAKMSFTNAGGNAAVTGMQGAVPASSTVKVYVENGGTVTQAGQTAAAADGSFALNFTNSNNSQAVYVTFTDTASANAKESAYAHIDAAGNSAAVVPIGQLRTNDAKGLLLNIGYQATIQGIVTSANRSLGTEKTNVYIQDATGGINVISDQDLGATLQIGQKAKVTGKLVFTAGMTQLVPTVITVEDANDSAITPAVISLNSLSSYAKAEPLEGTLVSVRGKVSNIPSAGPDYNVTITDDSGNTAIVKILGMTGIDVNNAISLGDSFAFTGIVGQSKFVLPYTSGYYLMPRAASDIKGDLQFNHVPLTKAYTGLDISFKATAKYADAVTLYYKNSGDTDYTSIPMTTTDHMNYNVKIQQENVKSAKIFYYITAQSSGQSPQSSGDTNKPHSVDIVEDKDGPAYSNELPAHMDQIETFHPVVSVDLEDPNGVDVSSIQISIDGKDYTPVAEKSETQVKLTLTANDDLAVGEHTVSVSSKDKLGNLSTGTWKFQIVPRFTGGNHYRGTTHNHTKISHDAKGDPELALQAAETYGYDYFAFSDHSHDIDSSLAGKDTVDHNGMPERTGGSDWQLTKDLANKYTKDGKFVVFPAFEMTSTTWGHSNVFGTTDFIDRVQNGGKYQNLQNYYAWTLTYDNIVAQFNHPAMSANAFDNFIPYDKNVDRLFTMLEVGNGSGHYSYVNVENKFFNALDLGWHVAPTYGEDNHDGTWGQTKKRTVIVSKDLSQESLLDAMRKMHVYFSEDPNFKLDMLANGYYMGATVDSKELNFNITGSDPVLESPSDPKYSYLTTTSNDNIDKVELITNGGRVIDSYTPSGNTTSFNWKPTVSVLGGQQWFVVRVTQKDGDKIYSSPIWSLADPLAVKVNDLSIVEGAAVSGIPITLKAGISNLGTINLTNLKANFYYDSIDSQHFIGDATIPTLASNKNVDATVGWASPVVGDHKLIVILEAGDGNNLGDNKFEQLINVKAPLGITVMIDATHNNENTTSDTGTYSNNLKEFTLNLKKQGYTVVENKTTLTTGLLTNVGVLVVTHPSSSYTPAEIAVIKSFVDRGGSLLLTEKSNFGGTAQNLNSLLSGIGSSILVNNDGVFDETASGNFWSTPLTSNFSVRAHLKPVSNGLTDFISLLDFYSGSSLAGNDGEGNKIPLTDSNTVTILAGGNDTTFQDSPQVKADTVKYNVYTANGKNGPPLTNVTGGSVIPLVASEQIGNSRIVVAGMNIFNDKQMTSNDGPTNNAPFELKVLNWLAHIEPKVTPIREVRQLKEGTNVIVSGQVTTTAFYDSAYIQDDTGGIVAFSDVPAGSLKLGDTVRVYGHIGVFENEKELIFDKFDNSIVKLSSGPAVAPKLVGTAESVTDAYQGQLVQVKGKVQSIPDESTYVVDDGSGEVTVFVDGYIVNQSGVPVPTLHVGDTLLATGLSGKYSQGNRIRVRDSRELLNVTGTLPEVSVTGVKLDKDTLSLPAGTTEKLSATILPADATNKSVTWSSSDDKVAKVDASGAVIAFAKGTAVITVTTVEGSFTAECTVTVTEPPVSEVSVTGVKLDKDTLNLPVGSTDKLSATVLPADATNKSVTWSSSNEQVAKVDANGVVTAIKVGTAVIKVTTVDGGFAAQCTITVTSSGGGDPGGNPGNDNGNGNGSNKGDQNGTSTGTDNSGSADHSITITPDKLVSSGNGKITVEVPTNTTDVKLPWNTADLMKQNQLEIKSDNISMILPVDVMKQLTNKLSPADQKESTISLKLVPLADVDARKVIDKGQNTAQAGIKLNGHVYEFHLSVITADGKSTVMSKFDQPITIRLKVESNMNAGLAAIYYISDSGMLEYIGGKYADGYMVAEIHHFSQYAVLEVTKQFVDVPDQHWAAKVIKELTAKQIVNGTSKTMFEPNRSVTRAEFTALLVRALNLTEKGNTAFTDVKADDWYAEAVSIAVKAGITQGRSASKFDPNAQINREEMVTMLMRAYTRMNGTASVLSGNTSFADESKIAPWALPFVNSASALHLVQGRSAGKFDPKGITTRSEAAQVIYNLINP
ncbi:S-layer homology domain-containing protein [Paenibacillus terrigena]|uniref:S-layer homology domain-containing protein n=1 Tax=Paenibacillus terrigena TaxID=369333 RepID=UPI0028D2E404|nr:S-layer homology domain-containing protein [Paenibacillus terrigena]